MWHDFYRLPNLPKKVPRNSPDKIKKPIFGAEIEVRQLNHFSVNPFPTILTSSLVCLQTLFILYLLKIPLIVRTGFAIDRLVRSLPLRRTDRPSLSQRRSGDIVLCNYTCALENELLLPCSLTPSLDSIWWIYTFNYSLPFGQLCEDSWK
jgi:hypothetical protein